MKPDVPSALDRAAAWLKENTKKLAFRRLEKDIIDTGACIECGSCISNCPEDVLTWERSDGRSRPVLVGKCTGCGICYVVCPRTFVGRENLIGTVRSAWRARAVGGHAGQNGGVATAIVSHLLSEGTVEGAVLTFNSTERRWSPTTKLVTDPAEAADAGGTIYAHAHVVEEMMNAFRAGLSCVSVVGTPCKIDAVTKLQDHPAGFFRHEPAADVFKIGLFCMEAFEYDKLAGFLKERGIEISDVDKMEISGGKFRVSVGSNVSEWPVADLNSAAVSSCSYCQDLTAKNADISCGNIGTSDEWTTVLVRTERGERAFKTAIEAGLIEAEELDAKSLRTVEKIARFKALGWYRLEPHGK